MPTSSILLTLLTTFIEYAKAPPPTSLCGAGWWYIGLDPGVSVTYQVMDYDPDDEYFVIGGSVQDASVFTT